MRCWGCERSWPGLAPTGHLHASERGGPHLWGPARRECGVRGNNEDGQASPTPRCPREPTAGCDAPKRALLLTRDNNNDARDLLQLRLVRNTPARERSELGDPTTTAYYITCVWDGPTLIAQLTAPPGANWASVSSKGYRYKDPTLSSEGLKVVKVLAGPPGEPKDTKVIVVGKGIDLPDPPLPVPTLVNITAQVIDSETGLCFGQTFTDAPGKENGANAFNTVRTFRAVKKPRAVAPGLAVARWFPAESDGSAGGGRRWWRWSTGRRLWHRREPQVVPSTDELLRARVRGGSAQRSALGRATRASWLPRLAAKQATKVTSAFSSSSN